MKRRKAVLVCAVAAVMLLGACGKKETEESEPEIPVQTETEKPSAEEQTPGGTNQGDAIPVELGGRVDATLDGDASVWYSFTTGKKDQETYTITFVNKSPDSWYLNGTLYDELGTELLSDSAEDDGVAASISSSELEPETSYYVCLESFRESTDYSLIIQDSSNGTPEMGESGKVFSGDNQDDAIPLPLGTKVYHTVQESRHAWFSFTTGSDAGANYNITAINGSPGGKDLQMVLYDQYGETITTDSAVTDGVPGTISADNLEPDTVYYVSLTAAPLPGTVDFSLQVKNPDENNIKYTTQGTVREAVGSSVKADGTISAGTSPNNAALIPFGTKVEGTVNEGTYAWFEFITGKDTDEEYKISITNKSQKGDIQACLYDEYGTSLQFVGVGTDGKTEVISKQGLKPETAYYILLNPFLDGSRDYVLSIQAPEENKENTFVFKTPFEINETQVQFVPNKAEFLDEAKAKEVLKPVAEAILAAPDHSVMIAGTTATFGDQASSVTLSGARAEAVKKLLTDTYNVPESQIETVGLGYELDPFERGKDVDANGNFVESEAVKNRRVVVLDLDDPIAQELIAHK